ncbi:MAG: hypothetical protein R3358_12095, partial [Woeseiaceae bacterium]|nr:hypothetical protein [Woeseiaceae bacterium]
IRDLTPEERELWRVYCLAKRCRVDLPLWVVPVFGWFAELEDGMDRARARAEREALSDAR